MVGGNVGEDGDVRARAATRDVIFGDERAEVSLGKLLGGEVGEFLAAVLGGAAVLGLALGGEHQVTREDAEALDVLRGVRRVVQRLLVLGDERVELGLDREQLRRRGGGEYRRERRAELSGREVGGRRGGGVERARARVGRPIESTRDTRGRRTSSSTSASISSRVSARDDPISGASSVDAVAIVDCGGRG